MCIPGRGDSRAKAWKCGAWCVWQNGALDQRECEELVGAEATMSSWGQTVKSLECQAKDSDCVWSGQGSLRGVQPWCARATRCHRQMAESGTAGGREPGEAGTIVQARGREGGRQAEWVNLCPLCPCAGALTA